MIQLSAEEDSLLLKFQSDITFVDVAVEIIRIVLRYLAVEDPTNVLLVSRELLKNAVVHGNQNDRSKVVVYRMSRNSSDQFKLEVQDAGGGFDWKESGAGERKKRQAGVRQRAGGHGFTIINSLCREIILDQGEGKVSVLLAP